MLNEWVEMNPELKVQLSTSSWGEYLDKCECKLVKPLPPSRLYQKKTSNLSFR